MIVCVCHQVSDREIRRKVEAGWDFSDVQLELGVATQCGQCEGCAREVVTETQARCATASAACQPAAVTQAPITWLRPALPLPEVAWR